MRSYLLKLLPLFAAFFVWSAPAAHAQEGPWRLTAREGVVRVAEPGQGAREGEARQVLAPGATVTTGARSRATIENGVQRMEMTANSRLTIAANSSSSSTRILQDLGSVLFRVDRRPEQHFRVETPLLAAVVKGTTFTVTANAEQDAVHVAHGLVEVHANANGAVQDVPAGETVLVTREAPGVLAAPAFGDAAPDAAAVTQELDYAALSDGLLEGPGAAQAATVVPGSANAAAPGAAGGMSGAAQENASSGGFFSQTFGALRSVVASVTGASHANQNNNGVPGVNGNPNAGGNGNGNGNAGDNGNAGGNGNGNGNAGGNGNGNVGGGNANAGGGANANVGGGNANAGGGANANVGGGNANAGGGANANVGGGNANAGGGANANVGGGNANAGGGANANVGGGNANAGGGANANVGSGNANVGVNVGGGGVANVGANTGGNGNGNGNGQAPLL
ncbi:MAG: hypothetical protein GC189_11785 [Alphaproteobacteria bacterium]|nr:hypothetical protein [Alphaproteobacteria bacterium]